VVDTSSAAISANVNSREVAQLPLNGRQLSQLARNTNGIGPSPSPNATATPCNIDTGDDSVVTKSSYSAPYQLRIAREK